MEQSNDIIVLWTDIVLVLKRNISLGKQPSKYEYILTILTTHARDQFYVGSC